MPRTVAGSTCSAKRSSTATQGATPTCTCAMWARLREARLRGAAALLHRGCSGSLRHVDRCGRPRGSGPAARAGELVARHAALRARPAYFFHLGSGSHYIVGSDGGLLAHAPALLYAQEDSACQASGIGAVQSLGYQPTPHRQKDASATAITEWRGSTAHAASAEGVGS